jgi:hypothetical protein
MSQATSAVRALLIYNLLAAINLLYLGVAGKLVGMLYGRRSCFMRF